MFFKYFLDGDHVEKQDPILTLFLRSLYASMHDFPYSNEIGLHSIENLSVYAHY